MSLGPIPSGKLKNLKDFDEWSFLSICLSVKRWAVLLQWDRSYSALSPVVHGDIALSINAIQFQLNITLKVYQKQFFFFFLLLVDFHTQTIIVSTGWMQAVDTLV